MFLAENRHDEHDFFNVFNVVGPVTGPVLKRVDYDWSKINISIFNSINQILFGFICCAFGLFFRRKIFEMSKNTLKIVDGEKWETLVGKEREQKILL